MIHMLTIRIGTLSIIRALASAGDSDSEDSTAVMASAGEDCTVVFIIPSGATVFIIRSGEDIMADTMVWVMVEVMVMVMVEVYMAAVYITEDETLAEE